MYEKLAAYDSALIDNVFQPLANTLAEVAEVSCSRAARACIDAASAAWILSQAGLVSEALAGNAGPAGAFQLAVLILGLGALSALRSLFQRTSGTRSGLAGANPLRPAMLLHRGCILACLVGKLLAVAIAPVTFDAAAAAAMLLLLAASFYVGACSTPPPTWERKQDRLRRSGYSAVQPTSAKCVSAARTSDWMACS